MVPLVRELLLFKYGNQAFAIFNTLMWYSTRMYGMLCLGPVSR